MNLPDLPAGTDPSPPRREVQLQGPRPAPLSVRKDSYKIKKPPLPAKPPLRPAPEHKEPVIIYSVSPKVIHTEVSEFMTLVQRLTGLSSSPGTIAGSNSGDFSPAARLASIEKTSPSEREKEKERAQADDILSMVEGVEVGQNPGILSPAPASLQAISAGFFSPVSDPQNLSILHDLSPFWQGNSFMPSPSTFFSAPIVSPTLSFDLFNQFMDF
ncbi:hypothetical protein L1049_003178 [Liquidambar formosana]|uniref:VQ domain-containing protein n=1 Tax=Liquidambar formosana TaxID=63359 RepID=A0AAP0NH52_LIQFO